MFLNVSRGVLFFFFENRFFSHPNHNFLFLHTSQLQQNHTFYTSLHKRIGLQQKTTKHDRTKHNQTRWCPSYEGWTRQFNKKERIPRVGKWVRNTLIPLLGITQKHQGTPTTYIQRLWHKLLQTLCLLLQSLWGHMSPVEFIQRAMISWCPPHPTIVLHPLPWNSQRSKGRDLMKTGNLDSPNNVWLWIMSIRGDKNNSSAIPLQRPLPTHPLFSYRKWGPWKIIDCHTHNLNSNTGIKIKR